MRRIRECLRLHFDNGLSQSTIARILSVARSTVWDYLQRARHSGRQWSELRDLADEELEGLLFRVTQQCCSSRPLPDWNHVHRELHSHSYVTLQILWEEYRKTHSDGYSYVRFCVRYRGWALRHKVYMRQRHIGGQKLFVDYSGKKPHVRDAHSGEDREVQLLVMCWGASHYIYAEAQQSQQLPDWIVTGHFKMGRVANASKCATLRV
jgi:transposase